MKGTKEYYEIQDAFERYVKSTNCHIYFGCEIIRAPKESTTHFYENGKVNDAFIMYMTGYSHGRIHYMQ